jgi:hypothetical protein
MMRIITGKIKILIPARPAGGQHYFFFDSREKCQNMEASNFLGDKD